MHSQGLITDSEVYTPNVVINGYRQRVSAFLNPMLQEMWLLWANRHDLMPNTRAVVERQDQITCQQAEAERVRLEAQEKAKQERAEQARKTSKRENFNRPRLQRR